MLTNHALYWPHDEQQCINMQCTLQNSRMSQCLVNRKLKYSGMQKAGSVRALDCPPDRCLCRLYLIPVGHVDSRATSWLVALKNENILGLAFTRTIWETNLGVAPKSSNKDLEVEQSGMWWWLKEGEKEEG